MQIFCVYSVYFLFSLLWMNALASSLHKFVMAFSIGQDLVCRLQPGDASTTILLKFGTCRQASTVYNIETLGAVHILRQQL